MKSKNILKIVAILSFIMLVVTVSIIGIHSLKTKKKVVLSYKDVQTGLDINGGIIITYRPSSPDEVSNDEMLKIKKIMQNRLLDKNIYDSNVKLDMENRIIEIELPQDMKSELSDIYLSGKIEIKNSDGNVILDNSHVEFCKAQQHQEYTGYYENFVTLKLNKEGKRVFEEHTKNLIGQSIKVFLNNESEETSEIKIDENTKSNSIDVVLSSTAETGLAESTKIANLVNSGLLPFDLSVSSSSVYIGPRVTTQALLIILYSIAIGIVLTSIYITYKYRLLGFAFITYEVVYTGLLTLFISNFKIQLDLIGILGFVLSLYIVITTNIVVFDKIREQLNSNIGIEKSVDTSLRDSTIPILTYNVLGIIIAFILYFFGEGWLKSFSTILLIGTIINMIMSVSYEKVILKALARVFNKNSKIYGGASK